ncbi:MAG: thermonuclease family protein [Thermodesulfobacteriota bacterium]
MKKPSLPLLASLFLLLALLLPPPLQARTISARVTRVVDGDTVVIAGGERVRYVGIDTPERGQPFFREAKRRNASLVRARTVRLEICDAEPRDRYGRLLAFVYAGGVFVNRALVSEGLARRLIIPPCGLPVSREFQDLERGARQRGRGIWKGK